MIRPFLGIEPVLGQDCFVADSAELIGDVSLGDGASIWFGAVARGDVNWIRIGEASNIQDRAVVHVTGGTHPTEIGPLVTVGHGAVVHGCRIEERVLIGIGAVILDGAIVESGSIIGAGAVVAPGTRVPSGSLVLGVPGKVARRLSEEEVAGIQASAERYVHYSRIYLGKVDPGPNPFYGG